MNMISRISGIFFLCFCAVGLLSPNVLAKVPAQCTTGRGYSGEVLLSKIEQLKTDLQKYEDINKKTTDTNALERSFLALRQNLFSGDFTDSFHVLGASRCFRDRIQEIEDGLAAVEKLMKQKNIWDQAHNDQRQYFLDTIVELKQELGLLKVCGNEQPKKNPITNETEINPYFREVYLVAKCPAEQGRFLAIRNAYKELKAKIVSFAKTETWKELFSVQGWKDLASTKGQTALNNQAQSQAQSWIQHNALPRLLGAEEFFESRVDNEKNNAQAQTEQEAAQKVEQAALEQYIANNTNTLKDVFLQAGNAAQYAEELAAYEAQETKALTWVQKEHAASDFFKKEIDDAIEQITLQDTNLKLYLKAIRAFINRQAQNQR